MSLKAAPTHVCRSYVCLVHRSRVHLWLAHNPPIHQ